MIGGESVRERRLLRFSPATNSLLHRFVFNIASFSEPAIKQRYSMLAHDPRISNDVNFKVETNNLALIDAERASQSDKFVNWAASEMLRIGSIG